MPVQKSIRVGDTSPPHIKTCHFRNSISVVGDTCPRRYKSWLSYHLPVQKFNVGGGGGGGGGGIVYNP